MSKDVHEGCSWTLPEIHLDLAVYGVRPSAAENNPAERWGTFPNGRCDDLDDFRFLLAHLHLYIYSIHL